MNEELDKEDTLQLEPEFPYEVVPFDPTFWLEN